jgi:PAS domain S-box-containing protein
MNIRKGIRFKLISAIFLLSLAFTIITSGIRSYKSYLDHMSALETTMKYIETSYIPSITNSLWGMDKEDIQIQLKGILHLPHIQYAAVISEDMKVFASQGSPEFATANGNRIVERFTLSHIYSDQTVKLGFLETVVDRTSLKNLIWEEVLSTLLGEGLQTLFLAFCMLFIIHLLITRHLLAMATYTRRLNIKENYTPLVLHRRSSARTNKDEVDEVVSALNDVLRNLKESFEQVTQSNSLLETEIIERKRSEEKLASLKQQDELILSSAAEGILGLDLQGNHIFVNPAAARMLGYEAKELLGRPSHVTWHHTRPDGNPYPVEECEILAVYKDGAVHGSSSDLFWRKDGVGFPVEYASTPIYEEDRIVGVVVTFMDITERKWAEEEKQSLHERLQRAEKMEALGQLAGGVAHDLNNVLGVLTGYSELLLGEIPDGQRARGYAEKILQSTEKGAAIIQDLLTLARRGVTASDVINLNSVVSDFLKTPLFENIKDYHPRVTFRTECDPNLLNIRGSLVHLEKTLVNLVSNAAESISGIGEVTIRTASRYIDKPVKGYDEVREGDYAVLTVTDTGMGIPLENIEKIFEPFYTKKKMGRSGTGLGLAIVWGTVKDHKGYIDVRSEMGRGSAFTLYFPVTREEMIAQQRKVAIEQYMGTGESVLVVDDIAEQREIATTLLNRLGYQVHTVPSGEEAVDYLKSNQADIMVLDMIMVPGIDGLETYQRVLEIVPKQKAIIVSGFSETDRVREAQKLGAGPYVKKPYILETIGMAIRNELNRA